MEDDSFALLIDEQDLLNGENDIADEKKSDDGEGEDGLDNSEGDKLTETQKDDFEEKEEESDDDVGDARDG